MWMYIIGGIVLFEVLGAVFFFSLARTSHAADQRSTAVRRLRIARRRAVKKMRQQLTSPRPKQNWTDFQKSLHS